ncbi:MAG: hypothetical protein M1839_000654 [Geoglossum umbratile]|nr:MAG: hypothetical protein M1839_000654 [Geoglossum umbratile]
MPATKVPNTRPKDANFEQKLIDGGIYPYGYEFRGGRQLPLPPEWEEINRRLAQRRPSFSPSGFSEGGYREFTRADARATSEDEVKYHVLPAMLKAMGVPDGGEQNIWFTNIDPIVAGVSRPRPDFYYGAQPDQIHPDVRNDEQLSRHITPSSRTTLPVVPNFSLEVKGPDGSAAGVLRQACNNGAVGARAVHSLEAYGQDQPIYNNNVCAISSTYHSGVLKMYGHSVAQPDGPGTRPEYYMHQLNCWGMTGDKDTFLKGATAFKNAIDLAEEYRDAAIARANGVRRTIDRGEEGMGGDGTEAGS